MKKVKKHTGFTFIELLIALVVGALLMTAIATVFDASAKNYTTNESLFKATNMARQALTRMTSQIRTASSVVADGNTADCQLTTFEPNAITITYLYDSSNGELILRNSTDDYTLCKDISSLEFEKNENPVKSVLINIEVTVSGQSKKLSAAAVVRRSID